MGDDFQGKTTSQILSSSHAETARSTGAVSIRFYASSWCGGWWECERCYALVLAAASLPTGFP